MPLNPGDVKLIGLPQKTYGSVNGQAVPVFKAFFTIRGEGSYSVLIPCDGFTPQTMVDAIEEEARKIVAVADAFR